MSDKEYTDGFLVPVPRAKLDAYREGAELCSAVWRDYGALEYVETVIDHDGIPEMRSFADAAGATDDEVVVLAWVVYPSKQVRDEANEKIMADPRIVAMGERMKEVIDCRKMAYGGFRTLVRTGP